MHRGSSPIFDVPEFPPLRRVKPLPKRRRTSGDPLTIPDASQYNPEMLPAEGPVDMTSFGLNMPLPQYYMPMFAGVQDLFRMGQEDQSLEYPGGFAVPVGAADEEDHGDGDYVDHLQQPGNTKKRKVPAAHHSTADPLSSPITLENDDLLDEHGQAIPATGRTDAIDVCDVTPVLTTPASPSPAKKNRSSAATLAGLQHKELLKTRKRQLAAVLGALSHGDTLALDQALSARYSSVVSLSGQTRGEDKENEPYEKPRRRGSKRRATEWAIMPAPDTSYVIPIPTTEFTFACPSPTSDRLISTRDEVAVLHSRFEAELSRQAAKAADVARQNAHAAESGSVVKRGNRDQQRSTSTGTITGPNSNNGQADTAGASVKTRTSKKKKRSALANASNPHHLRNYVPSRIPHSGQAPPGHPPSAANTLNLVSPPPARFLSAEIPPRRGKKTAATPALAMAAPEDEWICALCEYNLFYGEEAAFRRAVRSRKKILGRRRRARERAAAAASGQKTAATRVEKGASEGYDAPLDEEATVGDVDAQKPAKHGIAVGKKERDKPAL